MLGLTVMVVSGAVLSILIVDEAEMDRSMPLVAVQSTVVPAVSALSVVVRQPHDVATPDSGSATLQVSATSLVYQPLAPRVPEMVAPIVGGVVSSTQALSWSKWS